MHHVLATASSEPLTRALLWRDRCLSRRSQPNPDAVCDMCGMHLHYQPAPFLFLCGQLKPALAVCVASTFRTSVGCLPSLELSRESGKTRIRNGFGTFLSRLYLPARSAAVTRFHHCGALLQASSYTEAPLAVHRVILLADSRGRAAAAAAAATGREARRRQSQISAVVRHPKHEDGPFHHPSSSAPPLYSSLPASCLSAPHEHPRARTGHYDCAAGRSTAPRCCRCLDWSAAAEL
ncbi:hypothetical protein C8R45DRAFT_1010501, partial [Mycena sanguinolenta]